MTAVKRILHQIRQKSPTRQEVVQKIRSGAILLILFILLYLIGIFVPEGFDWHHFYSQGRFPSFWMPWSKPIVGLMDMPSVFALTVLTIGIRTFQIKPSAITTSLAIISLPTLWVLHLGTLDCLVLLGLLILPWGAPLVLIKPQVASFALLARRKSIIVAGIWVIFSLVIWGLWPLNLVHLTSPDWKTEWVQDIALFPWGLLIALPLMWFSRGDEDLLMAAGSFGTPHLFPYHFIVLMPALARMHWSWMWATWLISWTPLLSNWLGNWAWHFGNLMSVFFWVGIYLSKRKQTSALSDTQMSLKSI